MIHDFNTDWRASPVAVYDVAEKKLVMVFSSSHLAGVYVSNQGASLGYGRGITNYIQNKSKNHKNIFNRVLCFRHASEQQAALMDGKKYKILDDRFINPDRIRLLNTGFTSTKMSMDKFLNVGRPPKPKVFYETT